MRITSLLAVLTAIALSSPLASAQMPKEVEDPSVNSINRLPARAYSMPLADEKAAFGDGLEPATPYVKFLNGNWKISWCGNPAMRPEGFQEPGFDDSTWSTIDVPSCVEMRGFGSPGYTNQPYPHQMKRPFIRDYVTGKPDYNPVSSYRTTFTVPDSWNGRDVILRFDGVYSAYFVWVNGCKVGYAEDSKLPDELDITPYVKKGENVLAVQVYRWCDGSYLEDQDMFRFSGIYRDVSIIGMPRKRIEDFHVGTTLSADCKNATVTLDVRSTARKVSAELYDAKQRKVGSFSGEHSSISIRNAHLWSAEDPYLYTLVIKSGSDIRATKVGIKQVEIKDGVILYNGRKIKFKGVNRHEHTAWNGRTISRQEMLQDILLMKQYNINTERTSHYPDHHSWYDLCDRYGIYVVAEANVEGHGYRYGEEGIGRDPEWYDTIVERNVNHVENYRNHPSIFMWSLGNETGHGDGFRQAYAAIKATDDSRPIHWERGNEDADVNSNMYASIDWFRDRGTIGKPHFACEYAHAMGNAMGNFSDYWDVFYTNDEIAGACIWDWVDQALVKKTSHYDAQGRPYYYYAYGGDWDEIPNDGAFCCNGVIRPDRKPTAKLAEVWHVYRQIAVKQAEEGKLEVWNRFSFTSTDAFGAAWALLENGVLVASGKWKVPSVAPGAKALVDAPWTEYHPRKGNEYFLNVYFTLKEDCSWAPAGHVIAADQIPVPAMKGEPETHSGRVIPQVEEDDARLTVFNSRVKAVFAKGEGQLESLEIDGKPVMAAGFGVDASPRLSCIRAWVDNDNWIRSGHKQEATGVNDAFVYYGLGELSYHSRTSAAVRGSDGSVEVHTYTLVSGTKSAGFQDDVTWRFNTDGTITMTSSVTPHGSMPDALPRLGKTMILDQRLENVEWYGRGPEENYIDRRSGSFVGCYKSTVTNLFEEYVKPQDNGYRSDVRWIELTAEDGTGVRFSGDMPLYVQALHYNWLDLVSARHRRGQERIMSLTDTRGNEDNIVIAPTARKEVFLNLDIRQTGLGNNSCGNRTRDEYCFPIQPETWSITISPAWE